MRSRIIDLDYANSCYDFLMQSSHQLINNMISDINKHINSIRSKILGIERCVYDQFFNFDEGDFDDKIRFLILIEPALSSERRVIIREAITEYQLAKYLRHAIDKSNVDVVYDIIHQYHMSDIERILNMHDRRISKFVKFVNWGLPED